MARGPPTTRPADIAANSVVVVAHPHDSISVSTEALFDVQPAATFHGRFQFRLVANAPVVNDLYVSLISEDGPGGPRVHQKLGTPRNKYYRRNARTERR